MVLCLCTQEAQWMRTMLKDMGRKRVGRDLGSEKDNQGAIGLAYNASDDAKTKYAIISSVRM